MTQSVPTRRASDRNPDGDDGVKLLGPDGYKRADEQETAIGTLRGDPALVLAPPAELGRAKRLEDAPGRYIEFVKHSFPRGLSLDGLKVVVDCAHGAAYRVAPTVFYELGAEVVPVGVHQIGRASCRERGCQYV